MRKLAKLIFLLVTRDEMFKAPKRIQKKWRGVDAKILPQQCIKRLLGTLEELAFEFPNTLTGFYHWLQEGSFPQQSPEESLTVNI